jgi:hypothetical protein
VLGYILGDFFTNSPEADSLKILGQSELRHNSKDGIFTVVKRL